MRKYAQGTKIAPETSLVQIREVLKKAGATQFGIFSNDETGQEGVGFKRDGVTYRMSVQSDEESERARMLRALLLIVKAKIVSIESGVETFEETFLSQIITDDGRTYGERAVPQIRQAIEAGRYPSSLPMPGEKR